MRHGRRDRPQADPLDDAETANELDDGFGELVPAEVGLVGDPDEVDAAFYYAGSGETVWPELPDDDALSQLLSSVPD